MSDCALKRWIQTREEIDWRDITVQSRSKEDPSDSDPVLDFVRSTSVRDKERAYRFEEALLLERKNEHKFHNLTLELLHKWHSVIEPSKSQFRGTSAYAKQGEEEYKYWEGVWGELSVYLDQTTDTNISAQARAVRAYLDICFFHPFLDGNGRLAVLVVDSILRSNGVQLSELGLVFRLPVYADDKVAVENLVKQLMLLSN